MCSQIIKKEYKQNRKTKKQVQIYRQFTLKTFFEVSFEVKKAGT